MGTRQDEFFDLLAGKATKPFLAAAWQHFVGHEYDPADFAQQQINFVNRWDWDWVKINPRAVYYSEAWGSTFDPDDYNGYVVPVQLTAAINEPGDLDSIKELDPQTNPSLSEHLTSARLIREGLPDRAILQTVFSPLSVLLQLAGLPLYPGDVPAGAHPTFNRDQLIFDHPDQAKTALQNIAQSLAAYVSLLLKPLEQGGAGLDGIFFAVTGTVSQDYFDADQYAEFSKPYDDIVIEAVNQAKQQYGRKALLLHTCRDHSHPDWFDRPDVDILHWDNFLAGNPQIGDSFQAVPVGGASFSNFAPGSDLELVRRELAETIAARAGQPFLLAPSCTVPTPAGDDLLQALSDTRKEA